MKLDKVTEKERIQSVNENWENIFYITNPSEAVQLAAVKQSPEAIDYIVESGLKLSKTVQLAAVENNIMALKTIVNHGIEPDEDVQLAAVKDNSATIRFILNKFVPSLAVQTAALIEEPWLIKNIGDKLNPDVFKNSQIKFLTIKELLYGIENYEFNHVGKMLDILRKHKLTWPELDIIENLFRYAKQQYTNA